MRQAAPPWVRRSKFLMRPAVNLESLGGRWRQGSKQGGGGDLTEMENSYYWFLLWFITVYYGYYGTFLKDFIDSEPRHQKSLEILIFEKTLEKASQFITDITEYYGYYRNCYYRILQNITVRNIPPGLKAITSMGTWHGGGV